MSVSVKVPFLQSEHFGEMRLRYDPPLLTKGLNDNHREILIDSLSRLITRCPSLTISQRDYGTAVELINENKVSTFQRDIVVI